MGIYIEAYELEEEMNFVEVHSVKHCPREWPYDQYCITFKYKGRGFNITANGGEIEFKALIIKNLVISIYNALMIELEV
jgi:hypothetical protein